jgi:hypothetical protein
MRERERFIRNYSNEGSRASNGLRITIRRSVWQKLSPVSDTMALFLLEKGSKTGQEESDSEVEGRKTGKEESDFDRLVGGEGVCVYVCVCVSEGLSGTRVVRCVCASDTIPTGKSTSGLSIKLLWKTPCLPISITIVGEVASAPLLS